MQQSSQQNLLILKEVVDSLAKLNAGDGGRGRQARRYPFHASLSLCQPDLKGQPVTVGTALGLDISYTGITILSRSPIKPDTLLQVNLDDYLGHPWRLEVMVLDCMEVVHYMFRIACIFILDEKDL